MSRQDFTVFGTASEFTELVAVIKEQARREVLADLRAKASAITPTVTRVERGKVTVLIDQAKVLALFDE